MHVDATLPRGHVACPDLKTEKVMVKAVTDVRPSQNQDENM